VLVRGAPIHHGDFPLFAPELTEGVFDAMVEATHAARGRGAAAVPRAPRCVVVTSATMFTPGGFEQLSEATSVIAPGADDPAAGRHAARRRSRDHSALRHRDPRVMSTTIDLRAGPPPGAPTAARW
jgi:hypothetical protein